MWRSRPYLEAGTGRGAEVARRKSDYAQSEMEITPEICEPLEESTQEEFNSGLVVGERPPTQAQGEGMEEGLFEDLVESLQETCTILRDEREAARRMHTDDPVEVDHLFPEPPGVDYENRATVVRRLTER